MTCQPRDERKLMPAIGELNCLAVVGLFSSVMDSTSFLPKSAHKRYLVDNGQGCIHMSMYALRWAKVDAESSIISDEIIKIRFISLYFLGCIFAPLIIFFWVHICTLKCV